MQQRCAIGIRLPRVCAGSQERLEHLWIPVEPDCQLCGRYVGCQGAPRLASCVQQRLCHGGVLVRCGGVLQRRSLDYILRVDVNARTQQRPRHALVWIDGGVVQRRRVVAIGRIGVGSSD